MRIAGTDASLPPNPRVPPAVEELDLPLADPQARPTAYARDGHDRRNPKFKEANAAIEEAALVFVEKIVELFGKWGEVRPSYILETALRELSELLSPVGDHLRPALGPASLKLLDAIADYRDSRPEDR